jgi:hypothetical protein
MIAEYQSEGDLLFPSETDARHSGSRLAYLFLDCFLRLVRICRSPQMASRTKLYLVALDT